MVLQIFFKRKEMKNTTDTKINYLEHPNNHLYNTFVVKPVIHKMLELNIEMRVPKEIMTTHITDTIETLVTRIAMIDIEIMKDTEVKAEIVHKVIILKQLLKSFTYPYQPRYRYDNYEPSLDMMKLSAQRKYPARSRFGSPYRNHSNSRYNSTSRNGSQSHHKESL